MPAVGRFIKGDILTRADRGLEKPDMGARDLIRTMTDFAQLGDDHGILDTANEKTHVKDHWFGSQWWPNIDPKHREKVCQTAYVKAIDAAFEVVQGDDSNVYPKPIVTYWVAGGDHFEATIGWSKWQVTLILLTPTIPESSMAPAPNLAHKENCWYISSEARIDAYRKKFLDQAPDYPHLEDEEKDVVPNAPDVVCQRLVGY